MGYLNTRGQCLRMIEKWVKGPSKVQIGKSVYNHVSLSTKLTINRSSSFLITPFECQANKIEEMKQNEVEERKVSCHCCQTSRVLSRHRGVTVSPV